MRAAPSRPRTRSLASRPRLRSDANEPTPRAGVGLAAPSTEAELHARLAQRVRMARAQRGMTRKQLAQQSGISLGLLHKLALALNLPLESFLAPEETHGADFTVILEFLKRQRPDQLARIRRVLLQKFGASNADTQRVALIGIRGVGKSTLGALLANRLGAPFVELNREIEREAGLAVSEIFMLYGQRGYRQLERRCLE